MVVHRTHVVTIPLRDARRSLDVSQSITAWLENPQNVVKGTGRGVPTLVSEEVDARGSRTSSFRVSRGDVATTGCLGGAGREEVQNLSFRRDGSRVCLKREDPAFRYYAITFSVVEVPPAPDGSTMGYLEVRGDVVLEPKTVFHYLAVPRVMHDSQDILNRLKESIQTHDVVAAVIEEEDEE